MFIRAETYKELKEQVSVACVKAAALDGENAHLRGKLERAINGNKAQQELIITRERELDATRQEVDEWKKRFDQLVIATVEMAQTLEEERAENDTLTEVLDDVDEELGELVALIMGEDEKKKKGKKVPR